MPIATQPSTRAHTLGPIAVTRHLVLLALAAIQAIVALLMLQPSTALAGDTWCDTDPPVVVVTPAGNLVTVYVVNGGDVSHAVSLAHPMVTYNTVSVEGGTATNVKMNVTIHDDLLGTRYPVSTQVWSGPAKTGTLLSSQSGVSEQTLQLQFKLNLA